MERPVSGNHPSVDAVIVTTNRRELVLRCVQHLTDQSIASVTVVVNASTDGTAGAVREGHPTVHLVEMDRVSSLPDTNNAGAREGSATHILFLNDDILAQPGAVDHLAARLEATAGAVAAGGRLVDPITLATQEQYRPRTQPTLTTFAFQLLEIERVWPSNPVTQRHWGSSLDEIRDQPVAQPPGACLMVRRSAFESAGCYDPRFYVWFEDTDLTARLANFGSLIYVPSAVFRHAGGQSVGRWGQSDVLRSRFHGLIRYAESHFSRTHQFVLAAIVIVVAAPRMIAFHRSRPGVAKAYREIVGAASDLAGGRPVRSLVDSLDQMERPNGRARQAVRSG